MSVKYSTVVISDTHLGSRHNNKEHLLHFLKQLECNTLVINGDFIDGWRIRKHGTKFLDETDLKIFKRLLKMSKKTQIYWLKGNHDEFLGSFVDEGIGNFYFVRQLIIHDALIIHGDLFDLFTLCGSGFWAKTGSVGYEFLLWMNPFVMKVFRFSLSKLIKQKVKKITNFVNSFEAAAAQEARDHNCNVVICGHIHTPSTKNINGIQYINCGDWQESTTYAAFDGKKWQLGIFRLTQ